MALFVLAMVHELVRTGNVDLDYLLPLHQRAVVGRAQPGQGRCGLFAAVKTVSRWSGATRLARHAREPSTAAEGGPEGRVHAGRWPPCTPGVPPAGREIPRIGIRARVGRVEPVWLRKTSSVSRRNWREVAFEEAIEIEQPWTDFRGERHDSCIGRPVSFHAMRGISAHSNGFQTCRALHLLQMLLGSVECPGGFRFKPPYPKPVEAHPPPHSRSRADRPLIGPHLGFPRSPTIWRLTRTARRVASTRRSPGTRRCRPTA